MTSAAFTSDLHLGHVRYGARVGGRNARELDVERAWMHVVAGICETDPALVGIAGDVFEHVRPPLHAVQAFTRGIREILRQTDAHIVVLLGNHDAPKTAEVLSPVMLAEAIGSDRVHLLDTPERIRFMAPDGNVIAVAGFPFVALQDAGAYRLDPDPTADVNILLVHAAVRTSAVRDALPAMYVGEDAIDVGREAERWDVVACGDYHEFTRLHPTRPVFYSGSIERTASNFWPETRPKGWVLVDLDTGAFRFQAIPTRPVFGWTIDELLSDRPTADAVNDCLRGVLSDSSFPEGAIARLVVDDFPASARDAIDWQAVADLKARCLHFQMDLRFADEAATELGTDRVHGESLTETAEHAWADEDEDARALALAFLGGEEVAS